MDSSAHPNCTGLYFFIFNIRDTTVMINAKGTKARWITQKTLESTVSKGKKGIRANQIMAAIRGYVIIKMAAGTAEIKTRARSQDSLTIRKASNMPDTPPTSKGTPLGSKYLLQSSQNGCSVRKTLDKSDLALIGRFSLLP